MSEEKRVSNYRSVLNVVLFFMGKSPASDARDLPRRKNETCNRLIWVHSEYKSELEPTSSTVVLCVSALEVLQRIVIGL